MAEYIDKDTVLAIICKHWRSKMYADDAIQAALDEIGYHVPSADVAPVRHGRLLNPNPYGECSLCGQLIDIRDSHNYCPNCGAKMDGGEENE